jgi:hypothetical protein
MDDIDKCRYEIQEQKYVPVRLTGMYWSISSTANTIIIIILVSIYERQLRMWDGSVVCYQSYKYGVPIRRFGNSLCLRRSDGALSCRDSFRDYISTSVLNKHLQAGYMLMLQLGGGAKGQ